MPGVPFTADDFGNLEMVRQIVLRRLRDDRGFNHFYAVWAADTEEYVTFGPPQEQTRNNFQMLADDALWQLFIQGVITPGTDAANPDFPRFRITRYGQEVLQAERFIPHDPAGYLDAVRQAANTIVGQASLAYVEEALRCFNSGCPLASVLLLGIAAEAVLLELCAVARDALQSPQEQTQLDNLQSVRPKHRWLVGKYNALPGPVRRQQLPESLDVTLTSLYELIRRQRNQLGHPQPHPPSIDRDAAFVYFKLFPTFISDGEAFAEYCRNHQL